MLIAAGFLIALAIGLTGVGGGVLTAPILILAFGLPAAASIGTALLFSTSVKVLSAGLFAIRRQVHGRTLAMLLAGGVPGALLGPVLLTRLDNRAARPWMLVAVGITVLATAGFSLLRKRSPSSAKSSEEKGWLPAFSFPIGLEVGFSSAGAGALGTVLLFNRTKLAPANVVGTDLAFGLIVSACAGGMHLAAGNWIPSALRALLVGGIPGAVAGTLLAGRLPADPLRKLTLCWAALLGAMLAIQGFRRIA